MVIDIKALRMLQHDPDYIWNKRYQNSLKSLEERYPDGCPDHVVAASLGLTEQELKERYERIITCLRKEMGVQLGNE